jgi:hypothetical protein
MIYLTNGTTNRTAVLLGTYMYYAYLVLQDIRVTGKSPKLNTRTRQRDHLYSASDNEPKLPMLELLYQWTRSPKYRSTIAGLLKPNLSGQTTAVKLHETVYNRIPNCSGSRVMSPFSIKIYDIKR